eukprot:scaffold8058_cov134-Isochrysis_galbana.AAC.1
MTDPPIDDTEAREQDAPGGQRKIAAPAAACTCPAREAASASAIARALPSFVCVRSWRENQK